MATLVDGENETPLGEFPVEDGVAQVELENGRVTLRLDRCNRPGKRSVLVVYNGTPEWESDRKRIKFRIEPNVR